MTDADGRGHGPGHERGNGRADESAHGAGPRDVRSARRRRVLAASALGIAAVVGLSIALRADSDPVPPPVAAPSSTPGAASPEATSTVDAVRGTRLGPDGLAGLTLGEPVDTSAWSVSPPGGCPQAATGLTEPLRTLGIGAEVRIETDEDVVVGVTLLDRSGRVDAPGTLPDVWLGPTLGDPIADAVALPGARVVTEDPRGPGGPGVTSVVVDTDEGRVVFADPPYDQASPSGGRISHLTVRLGDEVRCRLIDVDLISQPGEPVDPDAPVATYDRGGTADVRLGAALEDVQQVPGLEPRPDAFVFGPLQGRVDGCAPWATTDGTGTVLLTDEEDVVVAVGSDGGFGIGFATTFGVAPGQPADEAALVLGAPEPAPGAGDEPSADGVVLDGEVAPGVRAVVVTFPETLRIETIDAVLRGQLQVTGLTLYSADDDGSGALC